MRFTKQWQFGITRLMGALGCAVIFSLAAPLARADAQGTPPATATPEPQAPPSHAATSPAATSPAPATPAGAETGKPGVPSEAVGQVIDVATKPAAILSGQAKWGDGFTSIMDAETKLKAAVDKAGLKAVDHPLTVFTATDDNGFTYKAMLPLSENPQGKTELSETVKLGTSPAGKALKFHHHGPYDDIDSTYDLITAYLDEKGLEAQDYFMEEYMSDLKSADDPNLAVDIYIFIK